MPEEDLARIDHWAYTRVPVHAVGRVRVEAEMADRHVTIVEARETLDGCGEWPRWPVARLNYAPSESVWRLYWRDGKMEFHLDDSLPPTPRVQDLIDHLDRHATPADWR